MQSDPDQMPHELTPLPARALQRRDVAAHPPLFVWALAAMLWVVGAACLEVWLGTTLAFAVVGMQAVAMFSLLVWRFKNRLTKKR